MSVPALESVPTLGAVQKPPQRKIFPNREGTVKRLVSCRTITSRLKTTRTNVGRGSRISAGAVVGEARELMAADRLEDGLDGVLVICIGCTKPGIIPPRAAHALRHTQKV